MSTPPSQQQNDIAAAIGEITEKVQLLVREEIELAKVEVQVKVKSLVRGIAIGAAAGVFVLAALPMLLHGFSWLAWYELEPQGDQHFFWGFFLVAGLLLIAAALAGYFAFRAFKSSTPPIPQMAIDEAKLIRETVQSSKPQGTA